LLVVTGYYVFTSLDLIDVAVVMLFTSTLVGITLIPYTGSMVKMGQEIGVQGFGKAWLGLLLWIAIAGAVLYRIFASKKEE
jgi:4-amino-4-deoxy-L-arabinose transferase-like glycosyltransferase